MIPVTLHQLKQDFSKLKLLKSYLWSTTTQERLPVLVVLAIESEMIEKIGYEDIIEDFISKNTKGILLFKQIK
jgi:hypothetical protein